MPLLAPAADASYAAMMAQAEQNAQQKMKDRALWVESSFRGRLFQSVPMLGFGWILFSPYWTCPWTLDRADGSKMRDGPKWTCGLPEIEANRRENCVIYSFGSRQEVTFERQVIKNAPSCEIHIFDKTNPVRPSPNAFYHCMYLFGQGNQSLSHIAAALGHSHIDLLKMDVEATEWSVIDHWNSTLPVGQIAVEFHLIASLPPNVGQVHARFAALERLGFRLTSIEPVGMGTPEEENAERADASGQRPRRGGRPVEAMFLHKAWTPAGFAPSLLRL